MAKAQEDGAFLRIDSVVKDFGDFRAVDQVSLDIAKGEIFALLGSSGCGKSTLLRMLAGFETPTSGRIILNGQDLAGKPPYERPVNMMFQSYALFPHLSVAGNIAFGLKRAGIGGAELAGRVAEMVRLARLEGMEERKPHQLSGGQRQRVALARALARRPRVLLLDEPLAALDKKLREETQFELKDIQRRLGLTFIIVTHDQEEAMSLATRIGVMEKGRLVQVAPPREVYARPATRFVAEFVGDITLLSGVSDGAGRVNVDGLGPITVAEFTAPVGAPVTVGIRPEAFVLGSAEANRLDAVFEDSVFLGEATHCRFRLANGTRLRVSVTDARRAAALSPESTVPLSFSPDAAVVLNG